MIELRSDFGHTCQLDLSPTVSVHNSVHSERAVCARIRRYYDSPSRPSAAQVCDSLSKRGYPKWLVPAVITSKADAKVCSERQCLWLPSASVHELATRHCAASCTPSPCRVGSETRQQTNMLVVLGLQKAAYLAEFAFKCERNPAGQTNYDWGYWFWILKVPPVVSSLHATVSCRTST
jgi:hypothetical protein